MREVDLRGADLNLLPVLSALLLHRSVTRAARAAGLSQPAMSRALGRLRAQFGDALLLQGRLTPRAEALAAPLAEALSGVSALLHAAPFDPATERGTVRIAATDNQTMTVLPALAARLATEAPGLDVQVLPFGAGSLAELREGRLDLAFGVAGNLPATGIRQRALYADRFVSVLRAGHPAAEDWTAARFAALDHLLVSTEGSGPGAMDRALEALGLARRVALRVPHFHAAFRIVAATALVATLPESLARREAPAHGLLLLEPPLPVPGFSVLALWGEVLDADPRNRWLRGVAAREAGG
jgi:DNA-binding transcriptional LysR family regulator